MATKAAATITPIALAMTIVVIATTMAILISSMKVRATTTIIGQKARKKKSL